MIDRFCQSPLNHPFFIQPFVMLSWLEQHLLPCAWKSLLGIDCPACGFQRSLVALVKGAFSQSFALYPPLLPVLLLLVLLPVYLLNKKIIPKKVMVTYAWIVLGMVMVSYIVKMFLPVCAHAATA